MSLNLLNKNGYDCGFAGKKINPDPARLHRVAITKANYNYFNLPQRYTHCGADEQTSPSFVQWDALAYTYNGNQLMKVRDNSLSIFHKNLGFRDGTNTGDDYLYDDNGNMTTDFNKGIAEIKYNHLNLPETIRFGSPYGPSIDYVYDATGTKLSKSINDDGSVRTEYAGNFIYNNAGGNGMELQFFSHPEGYVEPVSEAQKVKGFEIGVPGATYSSYKYVFQYKDHLGNVRLSYSDTDLNGSISPDEIIEESNYYPFGLKQKGYNNTISTDGNSLAQQWKFGGKEYNEELGLNWYDITARNYDPALGRWMNIDPLTEMMRRHSPYNYAFDNPIFWIDPDGMSPTLSPMISNGYTTESAASISGSVQFSGNFDMELTGGGESKNESTGLNIHTSAPTLSDQKDTAGTGMAMGDGGVGNINGNNQKKSSPSPKWYKEAFKSVLRDKFKTNFTFDDAVWHYRLGGGMSVDVNTNSLDFSSLSVKDFANTELTYQGQPLIYARLSDISNSVRNTNQALIYGSVGIVYLGNNTIMALPDVYDFDIKLEPSLRGVFRDYATMLGQMYNGGGTPYNIQFIGTAKIKN